MCVYCSFLHCRRRHHHHHHSYPCIGLFFLWYSLFCWLVGNLEHQLDCYVHCIHLETMCDRSTWKRWLKSGRRSHIKLNVNAWEHLHACVYCAGISFFRWFIFCFFLFITRLNCFDRKAAPLANHHVELCALYQVSFCLLCSISLAYANCISFLLLYHIKFKYCISGKKKKKRLNAQLRNKCKYHSFFSSASSFYAVQCATALFFYPNRMRVNQNDNCNDSSGSNSNKKRKRIITKKSNSNHKLHVWVFHSWH